MTVARNEFKKKVEVWKMGDVTDLDKQKEHLKKKKLEHEIKQPHYYEFDEIKTFLKTTGIKC
jgi:hypothetical protein